MIVHGNKQTIFKSKCKFRLENPFYKNMLLIELQGTPGPQILGLAVVRLALVDVLGFANYCLLSTG